MESDVSPLNQSPASSPEANRNSTSNQELGGGLVERLMAVLTLKPRAFDSIAKNPSTLQSLLVALFGIALVGSVFTAAAMLTVVYPVVTVVGLAIRASICRFVAGKFLQGQLSAQELPPYWDWIRAQFFATAPLAIGIVPIFGLMQICGAVYSLILEVHAFKDMSGCSTGQAVVILLISLVFVVLVGIGAVVFFGAGIWGLIGLGSLFAH